MTNNIEKEASVEDTLEEGPQKLPKKKMFMEKCIARMHNVLDKFKEAWIYWDLLLVFWQHCVPGTECPIPFSSPTSYFPFLFYIHKLHAFTGWLSNH